VSSQEASLEWMEMIGGDVGEGSKMLEVWRVAVLSRPQQRKLGHHAWSSLIFGVMREVRAIFYPR
jgi:hypothetical protein